MHSLRLLSNEATKPENPSEGLCRLMPIGMYMFRFAAFLKRFLV